MTRTPSVTQKRGPIGPNIGEDRFIEKMKIWYEAKEGKFDHDKKNILNKIKTDYFNIVRKGPCPCSTWAVNLYVEAELYLANYGLGD